MLVERTPSPLSGEKPPKVRILTSQWRGAMQPQAQVRFPYLKTKHSQDLSHSILQDVLSEAIKTEPQVQLNQLGQHMPDAQETICAFFLRIVKQTSPELVLKEFECLFIDLSDAAKSPIQQALYQIILSKEEQEFRDTLKRSCYILINNWAAARHYKSIQDLIQLFCIPALNNSIFSPSRKLLKSWLLKFINSQDYEELKLFAAKYENREKEHWKCRYTSYLLTPQYINSRNSTEQRQAARVLAKQLQDQFKFELAMYTARPQRTSQKDHRAKNPTALGDEALRLIKQVVAKRGSFSYSNLANIFISQTQHLSYQDFKQSLLRYLIFSEKSQGLVETLKTQLGKKLDCLYVSYHAEKLDDHQLLKTCNRVIEYLTTEKQGEPSSLFILLASQGNPLTLAILLIKLLLICPHTRIHLELCIANLIHYYEGYPPEECDWVINFLEIAKILLTIYTENVEYNLVNMEEGLANESTSDENSYRVFSQTKKNSSSS